MQNLSHYFVVLQKISIYAYAIYHALISCVKRVLYKTFHFLNLLNLV